MSRTETLTPERLFSDPPLLEGLPQQVAFTPNEDALLVLAPSDDRREWLDLWLLPTDPQAQLPRQPWLTASELAQLLTTTDREESEAERAERERRRQFAGGITQFMLRPEHAAVLVVCDGQGVLVDLVTRSLRRLTPAPQRHLAMQFSPQGTYLSYVRAGDLYALSIADDVEHQLTRDASARVTNGLADFIAQEEMHRFSGHWWSPDEQQIAFQRTDESTIPVTVRYDMDSTGITRVPQHYPYAGGPNARVSLGIVSVPSAACCWLDFRYQVDDYLARVDWLATGLFLQVQDRLQQRLTLGRFDPGNWHWQQLHEERSASWVNLHDNLKALPSDEAQTGAVLWTSEANTGSRLAKLTFPLHSGAQAQQASLSWLSDDTLFVEQIKQVDARSAYVIGWRETPTERHLYRIAFESGDNEPQQLTREAGWHEAVLGRTAGQFVDKHSSLFEPPKLQLTTIPARESRRISGKTLAEQPYGHYLAEHCEPTLGTLHRPDGTQLCYRLTRPKRSGAVPVIVHVYGGPGVQRVKNEWQPPSLQLFAQQGFAVFELDNRGSSGRGRAFEAPIYRALGTAELEDQLLGVRWLQEQPWVAADRIGLFGHSYGGYMTLRGLCRAPETFAAGVSVAPVTNWRLYDTHYTERYLQNPAEPEDAYEKAGILGELGNIKVPLLLMHGMADDNVLFEHTLAAMAELQAAGVLFELMTYPGSKHALQEPQVATHRFRTILSFFQRHLVSC